MILGDIMKKLLTVCACAALLLSGCQTQPGNQTSSVCENAVISMDSNVYQCDFIDLYEQARQFGGRGGHGQSNAVWRGFKR